MIAAMPSGSSPLSRFAIHAVLAAWALVCLLPLYWLAVTSLKSPDDVYGGPFYLPFVDFAPTLNAWRAILSDPNDNLVARFLNSAVVGLGATALTMLAAALAAYALTRFPRGRWLGNGGLMAGLLATRILPPIVIVLPLYIMAQGTGLLDTWGVLILVYAAANLPVALWLLRPVLGVRATDQEEAAQLDGASHVTIFFTILMPMAQAGVATVSLVIFVLCWNEYLFAAFLASDHAMTLPPWLVGQMSIKEAQTGSEAEEWANFSAATVLMAAPLLVVTGFVQRVLARTSLRR
jgi:multiple sugar transport system permease protein